MATAGTTDGTGIMAGDVITDGGTIITIITVVTIGGDADIGRSSKGDRP